MTTIEKLDLKVAVIGSGYWGKNLIRNYYQLGVLAAICDKRYDALNNFKENYPGVDISYSLIDIISRDDIPAVVIATPAETHYAMAKEALLAGKHVYVEKPLVFRVKEALELIEIAKQKRLILMVGHLLQYHPAFRQLKTLIQSGDLGRINYIYSNRLNLGKIRREENILWSFAPHDISMILAITGEMPDWVRATGGCYLHQEIADVTTTHLAFPSGLKAHIFVSWLHPYKEQKLVVVGDKKMAVFDDTQPWSDKLLTYPHLIEWQNHLPIPQKAEPERYDLPEGEPLKLECEHFLESITTNRDPVTCGMEGLRVLKVLNACQQSLDKDGRKINLQDGLYSLGHLSEESEKDYFAHNTAVIDENAQIGRGTKIWLYSHILSGSEIGQDCTIGQNVSIGPNVTIGDRCKIQNNVSIYQGVTLEAGVFCGPSMVFTNVYNPRAEISKMDQTRKTLVKKGSTIGANATIVCGVTLGRYSFVGAGAMVNLDVPDFALVVGNPAKQIGWVCECGERLQENRACRLCNIRYTETATGIQQENHA